MKELVIVEHPQNVFFLLKRYKRRRQEHFIVITLSGAHSVIKVHTVCVGLANKTLVHPREVFYWAIKDNACAIIIAHNHPSGNLVPSEEDCSVTKTIKEAGELLGIPLLDHIIITKFGEYSFIEQKRPL